MTNKKIRIVRFINQTGYERRLFMEALFLHIWIWMVLKIIPFKNIPGLFGSPVSPVNCNDLIILQKVKVAIRRSSLVIPKRNRCLVSSLTARRMLNRRNIITTVSLGMAKTVGGKISAHAWITSGSFEVVEQMNDYKVLYSF